VVEGNFGGELAHQGRLELAEATGISEKLILRWTNHADLFRINCSNPEKTFILLLYEIVTK
jgi:hypothetical protein